MKNEPEIKEKKVCENCESPTIVEIKDDYLCMECLFVVLRDREYDPENESEGE